MNKLHEWVNTGLIALVAILVLVGGNQSVPTATGLGGQSHTNSGYVINEDGTDDDTRIECDSDTQCVFVDAGNNDVTVAGLTQSDGLTTLTDANGGTYTLTQAELLGATMFEFAAGGAGQAVIALTMPATSTMTTLIPNAGDCRSWWYSARNLAAATTTTITAGTGHNIIAYTTNDDVIDGLERAEITMCRNAAGDVDTYTTEMLNAD